MALPQQFLEGLRANLPVSQIVGRRVKLTRRGREFVGLCPFHSEKTPSFTVNDDKGFYHCFGCGAHGDIVSFIMQADGDSFVDAARRLAEEAGVPLPTITPERRAAEGRRIERLQLLETACRWYQNQLNSPAGKPALQYLTARGLDRDAIEDFRIGYAPAGRGLLAAALAGQAGAREADLVDVGLVKQQEHGSPPRDYFFDRIIVPIADDRNRVIAFGGRSLGNRQPKYLNSPDNLLFHKGKTLYNEARAKNSARTPAELLVVEGYMDVIALHQGGFPNTVAPLGTAMTEQQLSRLWRLVDEPVMCFDGDTAGRRAALRAAERALPLLVPGKSLRFVTLPDGEDPDSLVRVRGAAAFRGVLAAAQPLVDLVWRAESGARPLDTPERRAALERALRSRVDAIADPQVRWQYHAEFRHRLGELWSDSTRPRRGQRHRKAPDRPATGLIARGDIQAAQASQERALLALLIRQPWLLDHRAEALNELTLQTPGYNTLLQRIREFLAVTQELDTAALERHLIATGLEEGLRAVLSPTVYRQASFAAPGGAPEEAAKALDDILTRQGREKLKADRMAAERDLSQSWNEGNDQRLLRIVREEVGGG